MKKQINALAERIHSDNAMKGFWDDEREIAQILIDAKSPEYLVTAVKKAFIAQKLALIHSEVTEGLEADRKDLMDDKITHRLGLEVELADVIIRSLDLAAGNGLDIGGAIEDVLENNRKRPFKHGKAY